MNAFDGKIVQISASSAIDLTFEYCIHILKAQRTQMRVSKDKHHTKPNQNKQAAAIEQCNANDEIYVYSGSLSRPALSALVGFDFVFSVDDSFKIANCKTAQHKNNISFHITTIPFQQAKRILCNLKMIEMCQAE